MRKILILITCITAIGQSFGQTIKFDVTAGVNRSIFLEKESSYGKSIPNYLYSVSNSYINGYHVGLLATLSYGNIDLQSGLVYTQKGGNDISTEIPIASLVYHEYGHLTLNYINLPINITYNFKIPGGKLFIGGGPYIETGLTGHYTATYISTDNTGTTTTGSRNYNIGFGSNGSASPEFGMNLTTGVHLNNRLSFSAGYEFGVTNVSYNAIVTSKNQAFTISASYTLFKKKLK